ncbi:MAG: phosphate signaling complex protein PhoU [Gemmatimonadetes bacterium]|nr:phosphate signaling complex protein PhoU [Gemmatimonadota bacterium]
MMLPEQQRRRRHFHDELDGLQDKLLEMAGIVEELVRVSVHALERRDPKSAEWCKAEDDRIDDLEIEVDNRAMELLALQQPMARDLRQVVATLKVANDLERVGDHAVNIAKAVRRLSDAPAFPAVPEVLEMAEIARGMLADALASFVSRNPVNARVVRKRDEKVDNLRRSLFRILLTHMLEEPKRITSALELLLISQNLERIADLSTNIAEDVVFLVEGQTIKHQHDEERSEDDEEPEK